MMAYDEFIKNIQIGDEIVFDESHSDHGFPVGKKHQVLGIVRCQHSHKKDKFSDELGECMECRGLVKIKGESTGL